MSQGARGQQGTLNLAIMPPLAGYRSLGEMLAANQVVLLNLDEAKVEMIKKIVDLPVSAPFVIESAMLFMCITNEIAPLVRGCFYDKPLTSEHLPPHSTSHSFVIWKDQRRRFWGKPINPATFGSWVFSSGEEYDEANR